MSYGTPFVSPLPTPGVTTSPTFEAQLIAWCEEAQNKLEQKVEETDMDIQNSVGHDDLHTEFNAAGSERLNVNYSLPFGYAESVGAPALLHLCLPVVVGDTLTTVTATGRADGATLWSARVLQVNKVTGVVASVTGPLQPVGSPAAALANVSMTVNLLVANNIAYILEWSAPNPGHRFYGARMQTNRDV